MKVIYSEFSKAIFKEIWIFDYDIIATKMILMTSSTIKHQHFIQFKKKDFSYAAPALCL